MYRMIMGSVAFLWFSASSLYIVIDGTFDDFLVMPAGYYNNWYGHVTPMKNKNRLHLADIYSLPPLGLNPSLQQDSQLLSLCNTT